MIATLRHSQPGSGRASRKPAQRGASRLVQPQPLSQRLPKPSLAGLKRFVWPVLLVGLAVGLYENWASGCCPMPIGRSPRSVCRANWAM